MRWLILLILGMVSLPLFSKGEPDPVLRGGYSVYGDTSVIAGISFPPFTDEKQRDFTKKKLAELSVDRIRIDVDWRSREPERSAYYWEPMDRRMAAAEEGGLSVFLTVPSRAPEWACLTPGEDGAFFFDEAALTNFLEELLSRYDNIDKIQFGNEWETGSPDGTAYKDFASIVKFVTYTNILYDAVERVSPSVMVVLGGLTRTYPLMEAFVGRGVYPDLSGLDLAKGATVDSLKERIDKMAADYEQYDIGRNIRYVFENARYDMIDIHLYDDSENWSEYLSVLPKGKPIVVSEFGGPNSEWENTRSSYQARRMEGYLDAIETLPVEEAYYFRLVDSPSSYHKDSGLYSRRLMAKPAREVFAERLSLP